MGAVGSRLSTSTAVFVDRFTRCHLPKDRDDVVDYLEVLVSRANNRFTRNKAVLSFCDDGGVDFALRVLTEFEKDDALVRGIMAVFAAISAHDHAVHYMIKSGAIRVCQHMAKLHDGDDGIMIDSEVTLTRLFDKGSKSAVEEIDHDTTTLQFCEKCRTVMERQRLKELAKGRTGGGVGQDDLVDVKVPSSLERVMQIVSFMQAYDDNATVQCRAMDALIIYAKNDDDKRQVLETNTVEAVAATLTQFRDDFRVIWRAVTVLALLSNTPDVAYELGKRDVQDVMLPLFFKYEEDYQLQQQVLWCCENILKNERIRDRVKASPWIIRMVYEFQIELAPLRPGQRLPRAFVERRRKDRQREARELTRMIAVSSKTGKKKKKTNKATQTKNEAEAEMSGGILAVEEHMREWDTIEFEPQRLVVPFLIRVLYIDDQELKELFWSKYLPIEDDGDQFANDNELLQGGAAAGDDERFKKKKKKERNKNAEPMFQDRTKKGGRYGSAADDFKEGEPGLVDDW